MSNYFYNIISGIVEGLTEFIPVSSTGHLIITDAVLNQSSATGDVFDVFIQIGAILAVVWARRVRIIDMLKGLLTEQKQQFFALKVLVAFIPSAIIGVLLHHVIKTYLFSPLVVALSLIVGGVFMLVAEKIAQPEKADSIEKIDLKISLYIGLCQLASLIPGISRAGASIVGARLLGVEMKAAAEFSFFLAIPTIFGAAAYDLFKNRDLLSASDAPSFAIGTIAAFVSGLIVVNSMITFVGKYGLKPFGYYRIAVGCVVLVLLYAGILSA